MSNKPIIVVFTATGKTGGGFIDAVLKDGSFAPWAVTRYPDSDAARALAARGVEVVKADLNDPASLLPIMNGAYGVLGVTDFWEAFHAEEKQGKDLVDAAKAAGIQHFVWSTLEHSEINVPHWETKARVDDYLKSTGLPRTSVCTSFFHENIGNRFLFPVKQNQTTDGKALIEWPIKTDGATPMIYAHDIGVACLEAFKHPDQWIGKDMWLISEWRTPREIAQIISEELDIEVVIKEVDDLQWKTNRRISDFEELWLNMELFYVTYPHGNGRDIASTTRLIPELVLFRDYVKLRGRSLLSQ
ncbi:NmrA-like domain-containing protein 1 [Serendipita sp. 399]|nr:NmrA-like domain-containing protein 1 [Serendipita sp. 399]